MFNPKIINNFISEQQCSEIVWLIENSNHWNIDENDQFWNNRVINVNVAYNKFGKEFGNFIKEKTLEIKKYIEEEYNLDKEIYPDTAAICRWFPGMEQSPHADDMIIHGVQGYEHRVFGSIIYLNIDYKGGHTFYPNQGFEITPEIGKVAIHPGDSEHLHGVTKVSEGMRYTIASFWTYDKGRAIDWSLFE